MPDLSPTQTPGDRLLAALDSVKTRIAADHANISPDFFQYKPQEVPGAEIRDGEGNSFDPPVFEPSTYPMVPDIEATQARFDTLGNKAALTTIAHAILCAAANAIDRLAAGHLDTETIALATAGIGLRDGFASREVPLLIDNRPGVDIQADYLTGEVTIADLPTP